MVIDVPDPLKVGRYAGEAYALWYMTRDGKPLCVGICGKDIADCKRNIAAWAEREGATFGH